MQHNQQQVPPQPQHMGFYQNQNPSMPPHHYPQMATPPPQVSQQAAQVSVGFENTQGPASNYMINCYPTNGWTGIPLISTVSRRPRKFFNGKTGADFDETAMSRLALHAHGAPLILAGRYRGKPGKKEVKPGQKFKENFPKPIDIQETGMLNTDPCGGPNLPSDTCLPRIIKPRKRRKKDRKPMNQSESLSPQSSVPTTPTINSNGPPHFTIQEQANSNLIRMNSNEANEKSDIPPLGEQFVPNNFYNFNDYSPAILPTTLLLSSSSASSSTSSIASSPNSLSNSSLSSTNNNISVNNSKTSSCSCRLCDPFCKIWAFPLRRSCSDNSADVDLYHSKNDVKKDVGVIGAHLNHHHHNQKQEVNLEFSFLDMADFANLQQNKKELKDLKPVPEIDRPRNESLSDSGDSGCDILGGLHLPDEILLNLDLSGVSSNVAASTNKDKIADQNELISENLGLITKQLSEFTFDSNDKKTDNLSLSSSSDSGSVFSDNSILSDTNNNEKNTNDMYLNFDSLSKLNLFSVNNLNSLLFECQNNDKNLKSPSLVNNFLMDTNNNLRIKDNQVQSNFIPDKDCNNDIFNCFDMVWKGNDLLK